MGTLNPSSTLLHSDQFPSQLGLSTTVLSEFNFEVAMINRICKYNVKFCTIWLHNSYYDHAHNVFNRTRNSLLPPPQKKCHFPHSRANNRRIDTHAYVPLDAFSFFYHNFYAPWFFLGGGVSLNNFVQGCACQTSNFAVSIFVSIPHISIYKFCTKTLNFAQTGCFYHNLFKIHPI